MELKEFKQLLGFFIGEDKWWVVPLIIILVLLGILIVFLQTSWLAPLVYPLI